MQSNAGVMRRATRWYDLFERRWTITQLIPNCSWTNLTICLSNCSFSSSPFVFFACKMRGNGMDDIICVYLDSLEFLFWIWWPNRLSMIDTVIVTRIRLELDLSSADSGHSVNTISHAIGGKRKKTTPPTSTRTIHFYFTFIRVFAN